MGGKGANYMENRILKKTVGYYDGFEYADIFEVIKETPKTVVLRLLQGRGLSSDLVLYKKGEYAKKQMSDIFIDIRMRKDKIGGYDWEDITDKFGDDGIWEHNR